LPGPSPAAVFSRFESARSGLYNCLSMNDNPEAGMPSAASSAKCGARTRERRDYVIAILIFLAVVVQGFFTIHRVGISWDEPYYFVRAKNYLSWFSRLGQAGSFSRKTLSRTFGFEPKRDDHPPLTKLLSGLTLSLLRERAGDFWAFRMSSPLLFGILLALIFLRAASAWGRAAGIASALCVLFLPRLFIEGHISATEMPLCFFWFLGVWSFESAARRRALIPLAGICCGLAMSVKFTGFLLPLPLFAWALLYARKNLALLLVSLLVLGPLCFCLLDPGLWHSPWTGFFEFVSLSLSRKSWNPHWVLFLGKIYQFSPPWYYAPFMVLVTVPAFSLALFCWGAAQSLANRLKDELAGSCLVQFVFLIAMTMLPNAPMFDGVRLFIPAFVFLGMIAGKGFAGAVNWLVSQAQERRFVIPLLRRPRILGTITALLLALGITLPLVRVYPYGLEYYNELIGGISGARKRGMETTYWWTVLKPSDLARVNKILPEGASLRFFPMDPDLWNLYQELGLLRQEIRVSSGNDFDYILILSRPYWNYAGIFRFLNIPQPQLKPLAYQMLDEVPLWALYQAPPAIPGAPN